MGDIDGNETISVGNIENATGIAIGPGATSTVYQGLSIEEVAALVAELKRVDQPAVWDGRVPYLGLNPFHESDAQFFFGREELVDDLLQRVQEARFIAIAGPSGSGKSSVARAGLFHALRQGDLERSDTWLLASMHPKDEPIRQLTLAMSRLTGSPSAGEYIMQQGKSNPLAMHKQAEALLSDAQRQRFILLVDQFEEIFTQTKDEEARTAFLDMLTTAVQLAEGRVTVIICMRSDFISHCANYPQLGRLISRQFQLVSAMGPRELAKAITLPALVVGAQIEAALAKQIIDDMKGEPGALPLMSFALRDLFESEKTQKGRPLNLTRQEYLQRGGIDSALQRHADAVFEAFTEEQQALAKTIFSRLIVAGEGRADTRRTAEIAELVPGGASATAVASVIARLAEEEARLVTTGGVDSEEELIRGLAGARATVTIAHEKLIDAWPWLRRLVDENRETIVLQNQISAEARIWNETEPKDDGYLYRGGRLLRVEEQYEKLRPGLDQRSLQFVEASLALRQGEIDADKARQQEKLDHVRALAEEQRRRAEEAEAAAERLRKLTQLAEARELAFRSSVTLKRDRNQGLLLAYRAMQKTYRTEKRITGEAHAVLQAALTIRGRSLAVLTGHVRGVNSAFFSVDGERIVTASLDKTARLWDREGQGLAVLEGHTAAVMSAVFSANRERIVTVSYDKTARLWDGEGQELAVLEGHEDAVRSAVFSADGERILTASDDKTARLWDRQGRALAVLEAHTDAVRSAVFSADGLRILTASLDKSARLWDRNGSPLSVLEGHTDAVWSAVFSADGARILTASKDKTARLWDRDGAPLAVLAGHTDAVRSAVFNANGDRILTASAATLRLWNEAGQELVAMDGHTGGILSALFSADGERILTASWDKTVRLWDNQGQPLASLEGHADYVTSAVFSADGERILTASEDKTARLWDGEGQPLAVLTGHTDEVSAAIFSADGERMVTASHDNTARLRNEEGQPLAVLEGHTGGILSAVFSMDGERIVTACEDKMARL